MAKKKKRKKPQPGKADMEAMEWAYNAMAAIHTQCPNAITDQSLSEAREFMSDLNLPLRDSMEAGVKLLREAHQKAKTDQPGDEAVVFCMDNSSLGQGLAAEVPSQYIWPSRVGPNQILIAGLPMKVAMEVIHAIDRRFGGPLTELPTCPARHFWSLSFTEAGKQLTPISYAESDGGVGKHIDLNALTVRTIGKLNSDRRSGIELTSMIRQAVRYYNDCPRDNDAVTVSSYYLACDGLPTEKDRVVVLVQNNPPLCVIGYENDILTCPMLTEDHLALVTRHLSIRTHNN